MPLRDEPQRWGSVSIALHWLTFLLVLGMATLGLLMVDLPNGPAKLQWYALHKSVGLTVLALTALRLAWRAFGQRPQPLPFKPDWQHQVARATHAALYALLVAVPLSGWWFNSAAGFPLRWFGLVALPRLTGFDKDIKALARESHELLFYALATLVLLHAVAAFWHHYRLQDRTLARMLFPNRPPTQGS